MMPGMLTTRGSYTLQTGVSYLIITTNPQSRTLSSVAAKTLPLRRSRMPFIKIVALPKLRRYQFHMTCWASWSDWQCPSLQAQQLRRTI